MVTLRDARKKRAGGHVQLGVEREKRLRSGFALIVSVLGSKLEGPIFTDLRLQRKRETPPLVPTKLLVGNRIPVEALLVPGGRVQPKPERVAENRSAERTDQLVTALVIAGDLHFSFEPR